MVLAPNDGNFKLDERKGKRKEVCGVGYRAYIQVTNLNVFHVRVGHTIELATSRVCDATENLTYFNHQVCLQKRVKFENISRTGGEDSTCYFCFRKARDLYYS